MAEKKKPGEKKDGKGQKEMLEHTKPPEKRFKEVAVYKFSATVEKVTTSDSKDGAETKIVLRNGDAVVGGDLAKHVSDRFEVYLTRKTEISIKGKDASDLSIMTRAEMLFYSHQFGLGLKFPDNTSDKEIREAIAAKLKEKEKKESKKK